MTTVVNLNKFRKQRERTTVRRLPCRNERVQRRCPTILCRGRWHAGRRPYTGQRHPLTGNSEIGMRRHNLALGRQALISG